MAYRLLIPSRCGFSWGKLTAVAVVLFVACALVAQDKPVEAWWLHATFTPTETHYESVPLSAINPEWVKITILSFASLPADAKEDLDWMHRDGFRFQVDDYFKQRGMSDRVLCGVFEDRSGRKGRFLLVLQKPKDGGWKVAYLHRETGEPGFSVLVRKPNGLFWGTCMQCEEFSRLRVSRGSFELEQAP